MFDWFKGEDTLIMVDPVMGDGGKLYRTYTQEMADGMARLCQKADIVVPNMTEACHLLGRPYNPAPTPGRRSGRFYTSCVPWGRRWPCSPGVA